MLFNYDPFSGLEEFEDIYYKAALAGFENLDEFFKKKNSQNRGKNYVKKKETGNKD